MLRSDEPATLTALGVAEVLDRLVRVAGVDPDELASILPSSGSPTLNRSIQLSP